MEPNLTIVPVQGHSAPVDSGRPWRDSLRRLSRAQALLWNETPVNERLKVLARVDDEPEKGQGDAQL